MELTHQEELRYNRQIVLKDIDFDGQETLKSSKMLIVGLGGLGCAAGQYLAVAGVGHLTLLDCPASHRTRLCLIYQKQKVCPV